MDRSARIRRLALGCAFLLVAFLSGRTAVAQGEFSCEDFLTQASAQMHLDNFPNDPYGLDLDGNGIACENMTSASSAPRADGDEVGSLPVEAAANEIVQEEVQQVAPTSDEIAYADAIAAQTTLLSEAMDTFSELVENPRIGQDDWTIQVAAVIVAWQLAEDEAVGMTVPPAFATFHESYLLSLRYLNMAGDDFIAGIDALDPSLIESANANIQLGVAALSVAQEELDRVLAERGVTSP